MINETLVEQSQGTYKGSQQNMINTKKAIADKYGDEEAKKYDPFGNCFTEGLWKKRGFKVKKDENALITIPTVKTFYRRHDTTGENMPTGRRPAFAKLYYVLQVESV